MPLRILTNTQSLFAQQNLGVSQKALSQALERLSSGTRINHAYDDPSGFLFTVQMSFQISGEDAGTNNLHMAIDLMNTADSYTRTISDSMVRLNELATQADNALLTANQRTALTYEFEEIKNEINRLTQNASYNGRIMLDGSLAGVTVQSGFSASDVVTLTIQTLTIGANGLNISVLTIGTITAAQSAIAQINAQAVAILSPVIAQIGAQAAGWMKSTTAQDAYTTNLKAARSRIYDTDVAAETTNLTNAQVIVQSGIAALAQSNAAQTLALGLIGK